MGSEQSSSLGHYEMLWDCDHCEAKGLLGKSQRHCPNCGAPQNADKRYFPEEGEEARVDGHVYEGADRLCPACSTAMGAKAHNCSKCGAPLEGGREVKAIAADVAKHVTSGRSWKKIVFLVVAIVAVLGFAIWWLFLRTKSAEMQVTGHHWNSTIAIEEYGPVKEESWKDSVPAGASHRSCREKERSRKQVDTGEKECRTEKKDKGDGTFEKVEKCKPVMRSEPVMDDWCTYEITKWHQVDTLELAGTGLQPAWPETAIPTSAAQTTGAKKQGARKQVFELQLGDQRCEVSESVWRKYSDGQKAQVEVRARSGNLVCDSL